MAKAKKASKLYPITFLTKEDILTEFNYNDNKDLIIAKVKKLTDKQMKELATKMVSDFEQTYWISLRTTFEKKYMEEIENESQTRGK